MCVETRIRAAIALVLTCMSAVAAQEPAVFRAGTDVVLVPVSVTDQTADSSMASPQTTLRFRRVAPGVP